MLYYKTEIKKIRNESDGNVYPYAFLYNIFAIPGTISISFPISVGILISSHTVDKYNC